MSARVRTEAGSRAQFRSEPDPAGPRRSGAPTAFPGTRSVCSGCESESCLLGTARRTPDQRERYCAAPALIPYPTSGIRDTAAEKGINGFTELTAEPKRDIAERSDPAPISWKRSLPGRDYSREQAGDSYSVCNTNTSAGFSGLWRSVAGVLPQALQAFLFLSSV